MKKVSWGRLFKTWAIVVAIISVGFGSVPAHAFLDRWSDQEIQFIDPSACDPTGDFSQAPAQQSSDGSDGTDSGESSKASGSVYMLGDSITVRSKNDLQSAFKDKGFSSSYINGSESRSVTGAGSTAGQKTSGLQAAEADKARIKNAGVVVVALGTNQNSGFESSIKTLVGKIKTANSSAKIYWANIFSKGGSNGYNKIDSDKINKSISKLASSEGFTVIDTTDKNIPLEDSVHPTIPKGTKLFAKTVADGAGGSSGASGSSTSDGSSDATAGSPPATGAPQACASSSNPCGGGSTTLVGSENAEKIFNFFVSNGLEPFQAAGIMGNMEAESGLDPTIVQGGGHADEITVDGVTGYGLVQWTTASRQQGLVDLAKKTSPHPKTSDLGLQLSYVIKELETTYKSTYEKLKASTNSDEATLVIELGYEVHDGDVQPQRKEAAKTFLAKYGSGASSSGSSSTSGCGGQAASGEVPSGSGKELAQKLLDLKKDGKYNCDNPTDCEDLKLMAAGESIKGGIACTADALDKKVLQVLIYLINQGYKIGTYALCRSHPAGTSKHLVGKAADISSINGKSLGSGTSAKSVALEVDKILFELKGELAPIQIITSGVGGTNTTGVSGVDPAFVKYNRVAPGSEGHAAITAFGDETMKGHDDHIHVGY